ncbi:hypothetical protein Tco_0996223 [Tanacetum coccineum]
MNNSVIIAYSFELHFTSSSLGGLKPRNIDELQQGDCETWRLRIESYIQLQDYALWEIIEDGNSFKPVARTTTNVDGTSTSTIPGAVTAEEKI